MRSLPCKVDAVTILFSGIGPLLVETISASRSVHLTTLGLLLVHKYCSLCATWPENLANALFISCLVSPMSD